MNFAPMLLLLGIAVAYLLSVVVVLKEYERAATALFYLSLVWGFPIVAAGGKIIVVEHPFAWTQFVRS